MCWGVILIRYYYDYSNPICCQPSIDPSILNILSTKSFRKSQNILWASTTHHINDFNRDERTDKRLNVLCSNRYSPPPSPPPRTEATKCKFRQDEKNPVPISFVSSHPSTAQKNIPAHNYCNNRYPPPSPPPFSLSRSFTKKAAAAAETVWIGWNKQIFDLSQSFFCEYPALACLSTFHLLSSFTFLISLETTKTTTRLSIWSVMKTIRNCGKKDLNVKYPFGRPSQY